VPGPDAKAETVPVAASYEHWKFAIDPLGAGSTLNDERLKIHCMFFPIFVLWLA
jgi:hypothetical protein